MVSQKVRVINFWKNSDAQNTVYWKERGCRMVWWPLNLTVFCIQWTFYESIIIGIDFSFD